MATESPPEGRQHESEWSNQVRSKTEEPAPLADRLEHPTGVRTLQVAKAAVNRLQTIPRSGRPEVFTLYQRGAQPPQRRFACHGGAVDATSNDQNIMLTAGQRA